MSESERDKSEEQYPLCEQCCLVNILHRYHTSTMRCFDTIAEQYEFLTKEYRYLQEKREHLTNVKMLLLLSIFLMILSLSTFGIAIVQQHFFQGQAERHNEKTEITIPTPANNNAITVSHRVFLETSNDCSAIWRDCCATTIASSANFVCFFASALPSSCNISSFSCRAISSVCCFCTLVRNDACTFLARLMCSSLSCRSFSIFCPVSLCRNFSVILRDSMLGKFSHRLSLVMHNNNEFSKIVQEQFLRI